MPKNSTKNVSAKIDDDVFAYTVSPSRSPKNTKTSLSGRTTNMTKTDTFINPVSPATKKGGKNGNVKAPPETILPSPPPVTKSRISQPAATTRISQPAATTKTSTTAPSTIIPSSLTSSSTSVTAATNKSSSTKSAVSSSTSSSRPSSASTTTVPDLIPLPSPCILQAVAESLHPSRAPTKLPCREREQTLLEKLLQVCIAENTTASVHVCGSPGVGKTAVLSSVFNDIQKWAVDHQHPAPGIHYLNGMSMVLDHSNLYRMLQERMGHSEKFYSSTVKGSNKNSTITNSMPSAAHQLAEVDQLWQKLQKSKENNQVYLGSSSVITGGFTQTTSVSSKVTGTKGKKNSQPVTATKPVFSHIPTLLSASILGNKSAKLSSSVSLGPIASSSSHMQTAAMYRQGIMLNSHAASSLKTTTSSTTNISSSNASSVTNSAKRNRNENESKENSGTEDESDSRKKAKTESTTVKLSSSVPTLIPNGVRQAKGTMMHIVVVDETDALLDRNHEMLYRLFLWPHVSTSRVIIISISNSIDMTQRFLPRLREIKLAPQVLVFQPYTHEQISTILTERLQRACFPFQQRLLLSNSAKKSSGRGNAASTTTISTVPEIQPVVDPFALTLTSRRVSAKDGDLRKALYLLRRAVLLAMDTYCREEKPLPLTEPEIDPSSLPSLPVQSTLPSLPIVPKNKHVNNAFTPRSPVLNNARVLSSSPMSPPSTKLLLSPVATQDAITPPHYGTLSINPTDDPSNLRTSPRLHGPASSSKVSIVGTKSVTGPKSTEKIPSSTRKATTTTKSRPNTATVTEKEEDNDDYNDDDEESQELEQLKTAILDMDEGKKKVNSHDTESVRKSKNGFTDVPFLHRSVSSAATTTDTVKSSSVRNPSSPLPSSSSTVRTKLALMESPILGKVPYSSNFDPLLTGNTESLCVCCRSNGFKWRPSSSKDNGSATSLAKGALLSSATPAKLTYAVSLPNMTAVLTAAFDRNRYCAALLRLPRDGQLLVCTARGLAEKEANKRTHLEAYERARKEGTHDSYVGTFDGAGLTFSGLATTMGAYRNNRGNLTRQLLSNGSSSSSSGEGEGRGNDHPSSSPSLPNLLATPITLAQLRETFTVVCRKRTLSSIDTSEFIDLIDRLESDGILTILNKTHNKGNSNGTNAQGRMVNVGYSSVKNSTAWLQSTARLNVNVEDVNFAFGDKTFFTNIIADVRRGVL